MNTADTYKKIVDYFNKKTNKRYKYNGKLTIKHIGARLEEGFEYEDFVQVINTKYNQWKDTDMKLYLRPETLFGTKFESYLNEETIPEKEDVIKRLQEIF